MLARYLADVTDTPRSLGDLATSLNNIGWIESRLGNTRSARSAYEEALSVRRRAIDLYGGFGDGREEDFIVALARCCDLAIACGKYRQAFRRALELWQTEERNYAADTSVEVCEYLLSLRSKLILCELETRQFDLAEQSATCIGALSEAVMAAFDDPTVDRLEQGLDSTSFFRCAEGLELVSRLRAIQGDSVAQKEAASTAASLRDAAERMKAREDAAGADADAS